MAARAAASTPNTQAAVRQRYRAASHAVRAGAPGTSARPTLPAIAPFVASGLVDRNDRDHFSPRYSSRVAAAQPIAITAARDRARVIGGRLPVACAAGLVSR